MLCHFYLQAKCGFIKICLNVCANSEHNDLLLINSLKKDNKSETSLDFNYVKPCFDLLQFSCKCMIKGFSNLNRKSWGGWGKVKRWPQ